MLYTELTRKTMRIAFEAHKDQVDKSGIPYIFHPIHLAEQMDDEFSCCVALLHDTVEDTNITLDYLCKEFPREVTDAVQLLTHEDATDYFEYIKAIRNNPIAKKVKLADLAHNSDQTRCIGCNIPEERLQAWAAKYAKAKQILTEE